MNRHPALSCVPRVLIVSVNPLSTTSNNGKTYASFFEGYPTDKLAQLYFHRELPTSNVCSNYYRVSDEDVLGFTIGRSRDLGGPIETSTEPDQFLSPSVTRTLASSHLVRLVRVLFLSLLLRRGYDSVFKWLDTFKPEVVFFSGGDATHLYPLVERIRLKYRARIVTYITDDYILPSKSDGPIRRLGRWNVRRHLLKSCINSSHVLTVGRKMSTTYADTYGIQSTPVMNLVTLPPDSAGQPRPGPGNAVILCYAGGLHLNRWVTLAEIGAALDRLNDSSCSAELQIYTGTTLDSRMATALRKCGSIRLHGVVGPDELQAVYANADLLVHVESFSARDRNATQLSISTKIPEYLAMGRAILAVGPEEVASIDYLRESGSAFVATSLDPTALDATLRHAIGSYESRAQKAIIARQVATHNHDADRVRDRLWRELELVSRGDLSHSTSPAGGA